MNEKELLKMCTELGEVVKILSKSFYETNEDDKNNLIQEAEINLLGIQNKIISKVTSNVLGRDI